MDNQDVIEQVNEWLETHNDEGSIQFRIIDNIDTYTIICEDM